jgi:TolB-like protein
MTVTRLLKPRNAIFGVIIILSLFLSLYVIAANKTVVLLPLQLFADPSKAYLGQGIKTMLASRLSGEGLEVITPDSVLSGADKQGVTSEQRAEEIARLLKANYAVFGSVTSLGTGYSLDLSFMDLTKDKPVVTKVSEGVTEDQLIPKLSEIVYDFRAIAAGLDIRKQKSVGPGPEEEAKGLFFKKSAESSAFRPTGRASVKTGIMSLDVGDLDGDGQPEILVLSREALMIYVRREKSLMLKETLRADRTEEFLKVSAADIDGNGRPEIYLVSFYGKRAQTSVWEWPGKFTRKLDRETGHFHVLRNQGGGKATLIFQDSGIDNLFMGKIWQMGYDQGGKLVRKDPLPEMKGAQIYTLTLFDYDRDGKSEYLALGEPGLDHSAPLEVWNLQGNRLTKLDEKLGGTNNFIRSGKKNPDEQPPANLVNGKIAVMDVDGDGKKEILVIANNPLVGKLDFVIYYDGSIIALKTEGSSLVQAYKSGKIRYCLTDMQVYGETLYISAAEAEITNLEEGAGRILWYE